MMWFKFYIKGIAVAAVTTWKWTQGIHRETS